MNNIEVRESLAYCAIKWKCFGYIIEERWNPFDKLATGENCFGNYKPLYGIFNDYQSCYSKTEKDFIWEMQPSDRTDDFLRDTRFLIEEAYEIVHKLAEVKTNGQKNNK